MTIYAEPKTEVYLPALDRPVKVLDAPRNQVRLSADGTLRLRRPNNRKLRYQVQVQPAVRSYLLSDRQRYLSVPEDLSQRVTEVGRQLHEETSFNTRIEKLSRFFQQQQLSYSATRLPATADPIDTFLFVSKRGYCEYFASSFAILLRLAGVPTRLVGGYLGGDYNELGGYYLITQDLAHVWVEALNDEGIWQRIDP